MKTRKGFVSNSSSSSFVIIIEKEEYERALETVHPYIKAVVLAVGMSEDKFAGKDVVIIGTWSDASGSMFDYMEVDYEGEKPESEYDDYMRGYEAMEAFEKEIAPDKCCGMGVNW